MSRNIEDLYRDDVEGNGKVISVGGGKELRGPCPICGGEDRFGVFPRQGKFGTFYCGRGKGMGNGCGKGGDAIQYLRDCRGYSYKEACDALGIETRTGGSAHKYRPPKSPKVIRRPAPETREIVWPEEVVDQALWQEHAEKFVAECHQALLDRPTSIAYLMSRGISVKSIKKFKLGFHAGSERNGMQLQPSFRPWPSWGLKPEKKPDGKWCMIMLPAGIVMPNYVHGELHEVEIRLAKPDPRSPKKKSHYVKGSARAPWLVNPNAKAFVLQEAKLDAIAVDEVVGDIVGTIALGTAGMRPDARVLQAVQKSVTLLDAMDFDQPRFNELTGRMERAGANAGAWWRQTFSQYKRWPVPKGKDAGDAFAEGVDLRAWILAGLPLSVLPAAKPAPAPVIVSETAGQAQEIIEERIAPEAARVTNTRADVDELRLLLSESDGKIRIYGQGMGVGPAISQSWSEQYPEKRRRVTELLHGSEAVGYLIENLADGVYGAGHLVV